MNSFEHIIKANTDATYAATGPVFDPSIAELVLRNSAVMADRLSAKDFSRLSAGAIDAVLDAANSAKELAPMSDEDTVYLPHEDVPEHSHRVNVWGPLHSLQRQVQYGEYSGDEASTVKLRTAVSLAGIAFAKTVDEARFVPAIAETQRYFDGNATAAARRASRAQ